MHERPSMLRYTYFSCLVYVTLRHSTVHNLPCCLFDCHLQTVTEAHPTSYAMNTWVKATGSYTTLALSVKNVTVYMLFN